MLNPTNHFVEQMDNRFRETFDAKKRLLNTTSPSRARPFERTRAHRFQSLRK